MTNLERSKLLKNVITNTMLYTTVLLAILRVGASQDVTVNVPSVVADNGTQATLNCSYSITGSGYLLFNVQWSFGEDADAAVVIANFFTGATSPTYVNGYAEPAFTMTKNDYISQLVIADGIYEKDIGTYWCRVEYSKGLEVPTDRTFGKLDIDVPCRSRPTLSNGTHAFPEGFPIVLLAEREYKLTCMVDDVKPSADFSWEYGKDSLVGISDNLLKNNGLFRSKSSVDLNAMVGSRTLSCSAVNKPGYDAKVASWIISVEDPCDSDFCANGGTCSSDTGLPVCKCKEEFSGVKCDTSPTETTSDIGPTSTESPTTINTGTRGSSTTPTGSSEMSTRSSEMTTGSSEMTTGSTEMTNSAYPLTPSTTAHTPETTPTGCTTLCDEATGLSIGIIIGIVVGSLCVVVITVGVGIAILKYNSKNGVTPDSNQSKKGKKKEAIEEEHV